MSSVFLWCRQGIWAEAVSTAAYLINKCHSSGIKGSIPDEKWYGSKSDYSRLKPFGCKAFAHLKQGKLSARALQCIMLGLVAEFGVQQKGVAVHCDNNGALCLARHQMFHERNKHIDVRLHFIRDEVESGRVKVIKIDTAHNPADMLTKPLCKERFQYCCRLVGLHAVDFLALF